MLVGLSPATLPRNGSARAALLGRPTLAVLHLLERGSDGILSLE